MKAKMMKSKLGFSLVELMIVLSIIGIIVTLALPRFKQLQARARQAEAKTNLNHLYIMQEAYYTDASNYGDLDAMGNTGGACDGTDGTLANDIGFKLTDCTKVRYTYESDGAGAQVFTATANSGTDAVNKICPGAAVADVWQIDQNKFLDNTTNGANEC